jgi:hypothetical protein
LEFTLATQGPPVPPPPPPPSQFYFASEKIGDRLLGDGNLGT